MTTSVSYRTPVAADIPFLLELEQQSFKTDRLSRRSFNYWLKNPNCVFVIAEAEQILGYALAILHRGTRLARLYSIAVAASARGKRVGENLMIETESLAETFGRLYMRLEVSIDNRAAIGLYEKLGYRKFGIYEDYYEDHSNALRMQKCIRTIKQPLIFNTVPWYKQTTDFTCGPAALIMAMASLDSTVPATQSMELNIWRQATTIFMTSGHGGCHPIGLALAAHELGFEAEVILNSKQPLFIDGVRSVAKKDIITLVDQQFRAEAEDKNIRLIHKDLDEEQIVKWMHQGFAVVVLISTNRLNGERAPHWVTITTVDDLCFYVHDPDVDDDTQDSLDCQHIPIARDEFAKMAAFGRHKLRTAVAIKKR